MNIYASHNIMAYARCRKCGCTKDEHPVELLIRGRKFLVEEAEEENRLIQ